MDRLCEKYGLSRLEGFYLAEDYDDLCKQAGIGDVCKSVGENVKWTFNDGYLHNDGTFYMGGRAAWKNSVLYVTDYEFIRTVKGSFNTAVSAVIGVMLCGSVKNINAYAFIKE